MSGYRELWPGGPLFDPDGYTAPGTDSLLLAGFARMRGAEKGMDLGCGTGIVTLLLLARSERLRMTALELDPCAAGAARRNLEANALSDRGEVVTGDIRAVRELFRHGSFDLVVANPPYFPAKSGAVSPDEKRAEARSELNCTLGDVCAAAGFLCRSGGRFALVHKPERLAALFAAMRTAGIEPKRLRTVHPRPDAAPCLVLVEGVRGGHPGLTIEAPLYMKDGSGCDSEELRRICRLGEEK